MFPYAKYEKTEIWNAVEQAVSELVRNQDLIIQTGKKYMVGYICQLLIELTLKSDGKIGNV